jgi:hypothetical protein
LLKTEYAGRSTLAPYSAVEHGKTLQSFLDDGLWDELRVETNLALTVSDGTPAPRLPRAVAVARREQYGDNIIVNYQKKNLTP